MAVEFEITGMTIKKKISWPEGDESTMVYLKNVKFERKLER